MLDGHADAGDGAPPGGCLHKWGPWGEYEDEVFVKGKLARIDHRRESVCRRCGEGKNELVWQEHKDGLIL
jgi:hypothetical protein